jgi:hypothetical protein
VAASPTNHSYQRDKSAACLLHVNELKNGSSIHVSQKRKRKKRKGRQKVNTFFIACFAHSTYRVVDRRPLPSAFPRDILSKGTVVADKGRGKKKRVE